MFDCMKYFLHKFTALAGKPGIMHMIGVYFKSDYLGAYRKKIIPVSYFFNSIKCMFKY